MRKTVGILFALVLAVSLVVPAAVFAQDADGFGGLAQCEQEPFPKWWTNDISNHLYLNHWGRTPIQAMSRLGGLCGPQILCSQLGTSCPTEAKSRLYGDPNACPGGCTACREVEQGALATCSDPIACDKSLSEQACAITGQGEYACPDTPVLENELATCCCCWGVSLAFANKSWAGATISNHYRVNDQHLNHFGTSECYGGNKGGDWGVSGCPHTECCSLTWCLQDNLFANTPPFYK